MSVVTWDRDYSDQQSPEKAPSFPINFHFLKDGRWWYSACSPSTPLSLADTMTSISKAYHGMEVQEFPFMLGTGNNGGMCTA